jgi:hypothetical protein
VAGKQHVTAASFNACKSRGTVGGGRLCSVRAEATKGKQIGVVLRLKLGGGQAYDRSGD